MYSMSIATLRAEIDFSGLMRAWGSACSMCDEYSLSPAVRSEMCEILCVHPWQLDGLLDDDTISKMLG